jgi:undecaprenyl-diphosphatase
MNIFEAVIIAIVEGLTEFLPVSSTGHMIITSSIIEKATGNSNFQEDAFTKIFTVAIQLGAILSVIVLYFKRFFPLNRWTFYLKLIVAVIPAIILGLLFDKQIEKLLGSTTTVAISLLIGGIILIFIDKLFKTHTINNEQELSYGKAFLVGCWQCIAMIPGVSRSASSIIGGMQQKLTRNFAAEFSFFLAVPTMLGASIQSLFLKDWGEDGEAKRKGYEIIMESQENITAFFVGNAVAFIVALLAIKFFISFLQKHGFRMFGWYRIVVGIILLILIYTGYIE